MSTSLRRVNVVTNPKYQKSGIKSYVYLLQKWGFEPTVPGPYCHIDVPDHKVHKSFLSKLKLRSSKTSTHRVLAKKHHHGGGTTTTPATGGGGTTGGSTGSTPSSEAGEVSADDQQNDSMYLCEVEIGTPPQKFMLDFDTGSADLWVWSTELPSSVTSKSTGHNIYNPAKSSTAKKVSGSTWKISYGDSSSASGDVYTDNVTIGGLTIKNQAVEAAKVLSAQFQQGAGDGLLGLAWGNINTVTPKPAQTPVENMITQSDIPKDAELFTAYLGSWRDDSSPTDGGSFYTFGYIDQDVVKKSGEEIYYTPVDNSEGFWTFNSTTASVNGTTVTRTGNTAIADTGTTLALVDDKTCQAIYAAIPGAKLDETQQGWVFPSTVTIDQLPDVGFDVGGKTFLVQKEDLSFADAGNGMIYGGIQSRGSMTFDILGDTFLKGIYAIFDQGNKRFGAVKRIDSTQVVSVPKDNA